MSISAEQAPELKKNQRSRECNGSRINMPPWKDVKQFRDPVYGYIQVPAPYVSYLIDTTYMQRIKGVAQSGLRPLFTAATHDRFSHSVGVYRFAMLLYESLHKSAEAVLGKRGQYTNEWDNKLKEWKNLLAIAALLHDIGHPVQSHSMEFLYDDVFLDFPEDLAMMDGSYIQTFDDREQERVRKKYLAAREREISYKDSPFKAAMAREKKKINDALKRAEPTGGHQIAAMDKNYKGKPHERMSVYYILTDPGLRSNIKQLCRSYADANHTDRIDNEITHLDELDFICRMITGSTYQVPNNLRDNDADLEYSLRNCVIHILNGTIDADNMDYIMRNSYSSGYSTSEVDYYRFCGAFSVYPEQGQLFPAWKKSALSVIEGFISARNYEPRWLYSHHKVVYQDVLVKEMLMDAVRYMAMHLPGPAQPAGTEKWVHYPFLTYILAPFVPFSNGKYLFHRSVDGDIESFFKQTALEMRQRMREDVPEEEKNLIDEYLLLYEEHSTRQHKKSLWKSFSEYKQALTQIARRLDTSFDTINRFTLELIRSGLLPKRFHLVQAEEGSYPDHYESEIIYYPDSAEAQKTLSNNRAGIINGLIRRHIPAIFGRFDPASCRVKIVSPRVKDFSREQVLFGDRHYNLSEMLDLEKHRLPSFPYLYYIPSDTDTSEKLRDRFFEALEVYCRQRITASPVGGNMLFNKNNGAVIRDVVHGDIFLPERYLAVVDTPEFQRLRRIKQLATAMQVFPNAGHSRFSHSLGTYYVMTKIVEHFEDLCAAQGMTLFHNAQERDVVLLSALLHDLGHGPYSHTFEHITGNKSHEEWTGDIILDPKTCIHQVIRTKFGPDMPERIVECIDHKTSSQDVFSFADIYPTLVSSQLDADRLDYLMRDSYNTAIQFGNIDIQNLISAMRITVIGQKYSVAIEEGRLPMVEHFLFGRFKMYEMVYYNAHKLFSEGLFQRICRRVRQLMEEDPHAEWIEEMRRGPVGEALYSVLMGAELKTGQYLLLDDIAVEARFSQWLNLDDPILSLLVQAFLNRNHTGTQTGGTTNGIFRRIRVFHEKDAEVQDLLRQIEALLRREGAELSEPSQKLEDQSYAFINTMRRCWMYQDPDASRKQADSQNVIWLLRENGTVEDIGQVSRMLKDSFHKSYLYYCEDIFRDELRRKQLPDQKINAVLKGVRELMAASHPRNMIEIEEKYSCSKQTLQDLKTILQGYTLEHWESHEGFYLAGSAAAKLLREIEQEDTYYDLPGNQLHQANCSLRCRCVAEKSGSKEKEKKYVFTIKRPTDSRNFGENEQFARFEFEMEAKSPELDEDVIRFVRSHLDLPALLGNPSLQPGDIPGLLRPILTISNHRSKGTVRRRTDGQEDSPFEAEICLDDVTYRRSSDPDGAAGKRDWQIELELKSDYLDRVLLKKFTNQLRGHTNLISHLTPESASKYKKARQFLGMED